MSSWQIHICVFFFKILSISYAGNIDCLAYQDPNCFQRTLYCAQDGQDCIVTCGSTGGSNEACKDATINCAPGVGCYVYCSTYQSCQNIIINGGSATTLAVYSFNTAQEVLSGAQINCENVADCDVTCTQKHHQCRNSIINAENAGQLMLRCEGSDQWTHHCQGLEIYCPKTQGKCLIFSPNVLQGADIYSELGFDGVQLCGDEPSNYHSIGRMHCESGYGTSCIINPFYTNSCQSPTVCDAENINVETLCDITLQTTTINPIATTSVPTTANPTTANPTTSVSMTELNPTANPSSESTVNVLSAAEVDTMRVVTESAVIAEKTAPILHSTGFVTVIVLVLLVLICCVIISLIAVIFVKVFGKNDAQNVQSPGNDVGEDSEQHEHLQFKESDDIITVDHEVWTNSELTLYKTDNTFEGKTQLFQAVNMEQTEDYIEVYEGAETKVSDPGPGTYQIEMAPVPFGAMGTKCTKDISGTGGALPEETAETDESDICSGGEENLGLYGPGLANKKTRGGDHAN